MPIKSILKFEIGGEITEIIGLGFLPEDPRARDAEKFAKWLGGVVDYTVMTLARGQKTFQECCFVRRFREPRCQQILGDVDPLDRWKFESYISDEIGFGEFILRNWEKAVKDLKKRQEL